MYVLINIYMYTYICIYIPIYSSAMNFLQSRDVTQEFCLLTDKRLAQLKFLKAVRLGKEKYIKNEE